MKHTSSIMITVIGLLLSSLAVPTNANTGAKKYLYASSYHHDYAWSNSVEQGEWWAEQTAIEIYKGKAPPEIPIVANRDWGLWFDTVHLEST